MCCDPLTVGPPGARDVKKLTDWTFSSSALQHTPPPPPPLTYPPLEQPESALHTTQYVLHGFHDRLTKHGWIRQSTDPMGGSG